MMTNAENQKNAAVTNLVYGVIFVLFSSVCFLFGGGALEVVTLGALTNGVKPEVVVTLVMCVTAPIAFIFSIGMYCLAASAKAYDPTQPEWAAVAAKKFVAAKVIVYQDLSDEVCVEKILRLSSVKSEAFQAAVKAELQALNLQK